MVTGGRIEATGRVMGGKQEQLVQVAERQRLVSAGERRRNKVAGIREGEK